MPLPTGRREPVRLHPRHLRAATQERNRYESKPVIVNPPAPLFDLDVSALDRVILGVGTVGD